MLEVTDVSVTFGGVRALAGASFRVERGELHAIIGPNGSGKTTMLNAISGFVPARSGSISMDGVRIDRLAPQRRAALGLGRTFQSHATFDELRVDENVAIGRTRLSRHGFLRAAIPVVHERTARAERDASLEVLRLVGLDHLAGATAGDLSYGTQRMLDLARAIAGQPKVLLLDEPAAGLNASEIAKLAEIIRAVNDTGVTVILIEHHMRFVMGLCSRITVLDHGVVIASGSGEAVREDPTVIEAYLGARHHR